MHDVQVKLEENGKGLFYIEADMKKVAEMIVSVKESDVTVFHTEVIEELKGTGLAGQLLFSLVSFAREQNKMIIPLCTYVRSQFDKNPERYNDVWNRHWHSDFKGQKKTGNKIK